MTLRDELDGDVGDEIGRNPDLALIAMLTAIVALHLLDDGLDEHGAWQVIHLVEAAIFALCSVMALRLWWWYE